MSYFKDKAEILVANGYLPVPLKPGLKKCVLPDWPNYRFEPGDAKRYAACGVGLLCGQGEHPIIGIDFDTKDPQLLAWMAAQLGDLVTISRTGNAPKILYVAQAEIAGITKMQSHNFEDESGNEHRLEILGYGQQFVAYAIHPETGKPYEWVDYFGGPEIVPAENLPIVSLDRLQKLISAVNKECLARGWTVKKTTGRDTQSASLNNEPLTAFDVECMRCKNITLAEAKAIISYIDSDAYDTWIKVGMALHLEYAGSEEALELWNEWSFKSANYPEDGLETLKAKWDSFNEIGKLRSSLVGMPSIIAMSDEARISLDNQMRAAAKAEFLGALSACKNEFEVETLIRKSRVPNKADREIYTDHAIKRLKELGIRAVSKGTINAWYKQSESLTYPMNELGLAERMRDTYKGGLKWDCVNGQPYAWRGSHWASIPFEEMLCYARRTVEALFKEADSMDDRLQREAKDNLRKYASLSSNPRTWENMIKAFRSFADGDASVVIKPEDLNKNLRYFGVKNGEIDTRTGEFMPGNPAHLISLHSPVTYDPSAECPYTDQKVSEICSGDPELIELVWDLFGAAMTGRLKRCFPIFYGKGHNGKSALVMLACRVFGMGSSGYYTGADANTFLEGKGGSTGGAREDILRLKDKRLAVLAETKEGARLASATVKQLTGNDTLTARGMYAKRSINFVPCCLPILVTNHRPIIEDQSEGIWDRLLPIHLVEEFQEGGRADPRFDEITEQELPGILNRIIEGMKRFNKRGLKVPQKVKADQAKYRAMSDPLGEFFDEKCVIRKDVSGVRSELYQAWKIYAREASVPVYQERKSWFFNALEERGYEAYKDSKIYRIRGITLKTFENLDEEQ